MQVVVADTGPPHYLILTGHIDILPALFALVSIPAAVRDELDQPTTPASVRAWIRSPPPWLSVIDDLPTGQDDALSALDDGERAAITLAVRVKAQLLLMDDRAAVAAARALGFAVTGTLGLLDRAARRGLLDLAAAFAALQATNFHTSQPLLDALIAAWRKDTGR